jgi:hypothetical protein
MEDQAGFNLTRPILTTIPQKIVLTAYKNHFVYITGMLAGV